MSRIELLCTGSEVVQGAIVKTNAAQLARRRLREYACTGLAESSVQARLAPIQKKFPEVAFGLRLGEGVIWLRLEEQGRQAAQRARRQRLLVSLRRVFGEHWLGSRYGSLEEGLVRKLARKRLRLAVAESCTGGLVADRITNVPGSSAVLEAGWVVYTNRAKRRLGVRKATLQANGAVSAATAREMARMARRRAGTQLGLATTGIAGPGGGTRRAPVGLVFLAVCGEKEEEVRRLQLGGTRRQVKQRAAGLALDLAYRFVGRGLRRLEPRKQQLL